MSEDNLLRKVERYFRPWMMVLVFILVLMFGFYREANAQQDYPRDITLSWTNADAYVDGTLMEAGDLDAVIIRCFRQNDTVPTFEDMVVDTGEGAAQTETFVGVIPRPGTYNCFARSVVTDGTESDDSAEASVKYLGKPLPPQDFR